MTENKEFTKEELEGIENLRRIMEAYEMLDANDNYYISSGVSRSVASCYISGMFKDLTKC